MKTCSKCNVEKPLDNYYRRSDNGRYRSACKVCTNKVSAEKWKSDPDFRARGYERSSRHQMLAKYGVTPEGYQDLLDKAGGCCEICGTDTCATGYKLAIDHCHTTGKVRGVLCQACNTALGSFKDDADIIRRAIAYLKETGCE